MSQPEGLGTPGPDQPDFQAAPGGNGPAWPSSAPGAPQAWPSSAPAAPQGWPGPSAPAAPAQPAPPPAWPQPAAGWPPATATDAHRAPPAWTGATTPPPGPIPPWQPSAPPVPSPPRKSRPGLVVGIVGLAVLLVVAVGGGTFALLRPQTPPTTAPPLTPPPTIVRQSPTASPATSAPVVGGQLGQEVALTTGQGSGTITVTSADWTNAGSMPPDPGESYLILEVRVAATTGVLIVGPVFMSVTDASGGSHILAFGPELDRPLPTTILTAGKTAKGQLAFSLPPGPATLEVLDESLEPVASIRIGS